MKNEKRLGRNEKILRKALFDMRVIWNGREKNPHYVVIKASIFKEMFKAISRTLRD